MRDALHRYRELEVQSSSSEVLVLRLYEAAIRHCRAARAHHGGDNTQELGQAVSQALAIVGELQQALDFEHGGEIAHNLDRLYLFVSDRLVETSVDGRAEAIDEAMLVLEPLCEGWAEIVANCGEAAP
ncbi:MAG: flagellar export chaperone FliS [Myxococcota bacterium]